MLAMHVRFYMPHDIITYTVNDLTIDHSIISSLPCGMHRFSLSTRIRERCIESLDPFLVEFDSRCRCRAVKFGEQHVMSERLLPLDKFSEAKSQ